MRFLTSRHTLSIRLDWVVRRTQRCSRRQPQVQFVLSIFRKRRNGFAGGRLSFRFRSRRWTCRANKIQARFESCSASPPSTNAPHAARRRGSLMWKMRRHAFVSVCKLRTNSIESPCYKCVLIYLSFEEPSAKEPARRRAVHRVSGMQRVAVRLFILLIILHILLRF